MEVHDYARERFKDGEVCSGKWKWLKAMREGARSLGLDWDWDYRLNGWEDMVRVGLVDVEVVRYVVLHGT